MDCTRCNRDISEDAAFCQFCGAAQRLPQRTDASQKQHLRRSRVDRQLSGVCGGIARYLGADPVIVRVAWVVLTIVPGAILLGVLAYLVAWLIIPEAEPGLEPEVATGAGEGLSGKRLHRSARDAKVGGVCGGIAEYFEVDSTAVRLLWVVLSIFPGAVVCGVLTYLVAWFIVPMAEVVVPPVQPEPAPAGGPV